MISNDKFDPLSHYNKLFEVHGDNEKSVQYSDKFSQWSRFYMLTKLLPKYVSILDFGCGLGDLLLFMRRNDFYGKYLGVDIVPGFIKNNEYKFKSDLEARFENVELSAKRLSSKYDFIVQSGVFNNYRENINEFAFSTLRAMYDSSQMGISFNLLSNHVDYQDEQLSYFDPASIFNFCKNELNGHPVMFHNYLVRENSFPHDFTVTVFKKPLAMTNAFLL